MKKNENVIFILKQSELFSVLPDSVLDDIKKIVRFKNYVKNDSVFNEGDEVSGFYIVVTGKVKAYKISIEGRRHIMRVAGPGDVVAEALLFATEHYPVTLESMAETKLLFIPKKKFINLIYRKPDIAVELITVLSKRIQSLVTTIEDLSLKEISARISKYLIDSAFNQYNEIKNKLKIEIQIPKHELAASLGTIPETLSRVLKKMQKQDIIKNDPRTIILLDVKKLYQLASGKKL